MYANNDEIIVDECNEECIFNKNGLCHRTMDYCQKE